MLTKYLLALNYFPTSTPDTAARRLRRWINQSAGLRQALAETGYQSQQHHFTSRQVELIREYLGEP